MRAVILGTDYVKDIDGSFKALETNTNIALSVNTLTHLDTGSFQQFISDGGFDKINLIASEANLEVFEWGTFENSQISFNGYLKQYCSGSGIDYSYIRIDESAITIPDIEDSETTLTIRISYDTTALIDSEYSGDNWGFLKLMYDGDSNSIPKTYINDDDFGFDSIGTTIRDNGVHPNYCVKKRVTPSDNNIYPIFHKINTIEELENLKNSLQVDEYIQEYIFNSNELLNGKLKHYRSVDMVYGSELNSMNLWIHELSNLKELVNVPDYDDNGIVQIWDRVCYKNKYRATTADIAIKFSADESTGIIKEDNSIVDVNQISVLDRVKSISITSLSNALPNNSLFAWSSSYSSEFTDFEISSSLLESKNSREYFGHIVYIQTENGFQSSDVPHASILTKKEEDGQTYIKFKNYEHIAVNDTIFLFDLEENRFVEDTVISVQYNFDSITAYTLDFEELDVFLTVEETPNRSKYALLSHNYDYDCRNYSCPVPGDGLRDTYRCSDAVIFDVCNFNYTNSLCARVGGPFYPVAWIKCWYTYWVPAFPDGYTVCAQWGPAVAGSYCNGNKPSDKSLKKKVKLLGKNKNNLNIYEFEYRDSIVELWLSKTGENIAGNWKGVIAQDLIGTQYENALTWEEEGFYSVNYDLLPNIEL